MNADLRLELGVLVREIIWMFLYSIVFIIMDSLSFCIRFDSDYLYSVFLFNSSVFSE